jgi:DNA-binding transcriptional MerR regulator
LNKAPDAFRTISEVAEELDLPQHVLRFWESRFPHIKPLKRGGGRRYYRPDDVDLLRGIRRLLYSDGYTIKGVQRILREQGVRTVQSVGQGQTLSPSLPPLDDGPDDDDGNNGTGAAVNSLLLPPSRPLDEAEDESRRPQALAVAKSAPPKNGPISEAGVIAVAQAAKIEPVKERGRVAGAIVVSPAAAPAHPHVAAKALPTLDLDRLKQALADLEACRRLLDKAIEGGR